MIRTTAEQYDIRGILDEMRDEYRRAVEVGEDESVIATRDYVVFALGRERYGIESRFAREVLRLPRSVPVPRLPEHFVGIFNLRGQIHAITDLRPLFGLPRQELSSRPQVIVVEAAGLTTALYTDKVQGIVPIAPEAIEAVAEDLPGLEREVMSGRVAQGEGTLLILDLERLMDRPELVVEVSSEAS